LTASKLSIRISLPTEVANIYAAGDVFGFAALATTSMEQGPVASSHMFGLSYDLA
jgi:NAD(P) transhydrogenase